MSQTPLSPRHGGATFSRCGRYRYELWRDLHGNGLTETYVNFIMLNPSTADAQYNDATLRRCIGFTRSWGFSQLVVTNLFAVCSKSPKDLTVPAHQSVVGYENDAYLKKRAAAAQIVVCAWGPNGRLWNRDESVVRLLHDLGRTLYALGLTKDGSPSHPLRLPAHLQPFRCDAFPRIRAS